MNRIQVAAYCTLEQKERLQELAELELCSLSTMLTKLIDEAWELNFNEQNPSQAEPNPYPRGEF
jgi:hypothetical protein